MLYLQDPGCYSGNAVFGYPGLDVSSRDIFIHADTATSQITVGVNALMEKEETTRPHGQEM